MWYWFIFLPYVCPFLKISCWRIYWWLCKQNITWLRRSVRKRKGETVQLNIVGYYPRSKITIPQDIDIAVFVSRVSMLILSVKCVPMIKFQWSFVLHIINELVLLNLYIPQKGKNSSNAKRFLWRTRWFDSYDVFMMMVWDEINGRNHLQL